MRLLYTIHDRPHLEKRTPNESFAMTQDSGGNGRRSSLSAIGVETSSTGGAHIIGYDVYHIYADYYPQNKNSGDRVSAMFGTVLLAPYRYS